MHRNHFQIFDYDTLLKLDGFKSSSFCATLSGIYKLGCKRGASFRGKIESIARLDLQELDGLKPSSCKRVCLFNLISAVALVQNARIMARQRVGDSRCFAPEPLLQPSAESMPKNPRTLLEKSFRQIDSAVL